MPKINSIWLQKIIYQENKAWSQIILSLTHQKRGVYEALETKEWYLAVVTSLFGFRSWLIVCKLQISRQNCDIPCLTISYFWIHGVIMLIQTANIKTKFVWHKCRSNQSFKPQRSESVAHLLGGSGWRNPSEKKNNLMHFGPKFCKAHIWVRFPRTGKMVEMWHLFLFFWSSSVTKQFDFFQLFSTVPKTFCPLHF